VTARNPAAANTVDELRNKIAAGSRDPKNYSDLASLSFDAGHYDEAIAIHQEALRLPLSNLQRGRVHLDLAWLFHWLEKSAQARTEAEEAARLFSKEPESKEVTFLRGITESLLAQCSEDPDTSTNAARLGLRWLNALIADDPDFENIAFAYFQAARLHNQLGNPKEAIKLCKECLQKDLSPEERLDCLVEFVEALRLTRQFTEAEHALREELKRTNKGNRAKLYSTLGLVLRSSNRPAEARDFLLEALSELKAQADLVTNAALVKEINWTLGELYYESGEYDQAITTYKELLALYPEDDVNHRNALSEVGQCYYRKGRLTEAESCYTQVLNSHNASSRERALIQQGLGNIYYDLGEYDKAIEAFEKVFACFPRNDPVCCTSLLWLGYCWEAKGEYEKARCCYEEVHASPNASEEEKTSAKECLAQLPTLPKRTLQ